MLSKATVTDSSPSRKARYRNVKQSALVHTGPRHRLPAPSGPPQRNTEDWGQGTHGAMPPQCTRAAPPGRRSPAAPPGRRSPASPHNKPQGGSHAPRSRVNPPPWARVPGGGPHTQPPPGAPTTQRTPAPASPPSSTHLAARDGREPEFGILNSAFAPNASKSRRRFQAAVLCVRTGNIT